jgi:hypothetical protein
MVGRKYQNCEINWDENVFAWHFRNYKSLLKAILFKINAIFGLIFLHLHLSPALDFQAP